MTYSYYPGCTLKTKAKDLDKYARLSAEALLRNCPIGSVAAVFIRWQRMKSQPSCHLSEP